MYRSHDPCIQWPHYLSVSVSSYETHYESVCRNPSLPISLIIDPLSGQPAGQRRLDLAIHVSIDIIISRPRYLPVDLTTIHLSV